MKNKLKVAVIVLIVAAIIAASCAYVKMHQGPETPKEKILVIATPEEIQGTDIQQVDWSNIVHDLIFQPLVAYTLDLKGVVPDLAENFEVSPNGTEITFKLPTDAKFSNGDPLTAEDVKNSILRYRQISPYADDFAPVKDIIVKDEHTVTLVLKSPSPYLWAVLASTYAAPVDVKVAEKVGKEEFNRKAVGSGPFMVEEWVQGSHIVLVKNPYYKTNIPFVNNKGPFKFDKVIVRFIPDDFTRISELEAGNVHLIVNVPVENVETLKNNPDVQLFSYLQPGVDYILINTNKTPLNDVRVRKAIALAINREELKASLDNLVRPAYGYLSPAQVGYNEETEKELQQNYSYNIEKAKKLLAEAGWEDKDGDGIVEKDGKPLSLTLLVPLDAPMEKKAAPIIQAQLRELGIDLKLREYETAYIREMTEEGNFELAMRYYWWSDADIMIYIYHSSAGYPWSNSTVDKLLEEARTITDFEKRAEVYGEIQQIIAKEMPSIPLFSEYEYVAARKEVKGIVIGVDGTLYLNDVDIES